MRQELALWAKKNSVYCLDSDVAIGSAGDVVDDFIVKKTNEVNRASLIGAFLATRALVLDCARFFLQNFTVYLRFIFQDVRRARG